MTLPVMLIQVGVGAVGSEVVRLVLGHRDLWRRLYGLQVDYTGLLDSRGGYYNLSTIPVPLVRDLLLAKAAGRSLMEVEDGEPITVMEALSRQEAPGRTIMVDCATGDGTYGAHLWNLQDPEASVLANKAPLTVEQDRYDALVECGRTRLWYEATVGAGLPVISTLRSLLAAGDEVLEIRACASGTLGYITSEMMAGRAYSEAVATAKSRGYTEPDPRDDLSGLDVARKAMILARTFGRRLELSDIRVEPLMPALDPALSVDAFLAALPAADAEFAERVARARRSGSALKYVATIPAEGGITVGLQEVPAQSQMGSLAGPDNIFVFRTRAYDENPLTVIGPGAGPVVTAMGVVGDILQAARR